ncbi:MAG: hypothetical protein U0L48_05715 [Acutalibacteraceae bacterium]|nr:hypothetical protein [Acutalibacteraceae bacterium]
MNNSTENEIREKEINVVKRLIEFGLNEEEIWKILSTALYDVIFAKLSEESKDDIG